MRTCSYLSRDQKEMIVRLAKESMTQRKIAKLVACGVASVCRVLQASYQVRCSHPAICTILQLSFQPNGLEIRQKSGRPRVTTIKEDRLFRREYMKDRRKSAVELARIVRPVTPQASRVPRPSVSVDTWRRRLKEVGLQNYTMKKKVALNERQRKLRFEFCQRFKDWLVEDWKKVIFSDECNVDAEPSGGTRTVWRKPSEKNAAFAIKQVFHYFLASTCFYGSSNHFTLSRHTSFQHQ